MSRFDVYRTGNRAKPLLVDVQADLLSELATRVAVPLSPEHLAPREELPRLKPVLSIQGDRYVFLSTEIAAVPASFLRDPVANIEVQHRDDITRALDFLFQGF